MKSSQTRINHLMKFCALPLLFLGSSALAQEIRSSRDYILIYGHVAKQFPDLKIVPGVYLNPAIQIDRPDINNLVHGGISEKKTGMFDSIILGRAPGTIVNTHNEVWAKTQGRNFLLIGQNNVYQLVSPKIPAHLIPAKDGFFSIGAALRPYFTSNELKDIKSNPHELDETKPQIRSKEGLEGIEIDANDYMVSADGLGLLYVTVQGTLALCRQDSCRDIPNIKSDKGWGISREGIYSSQKIGDKQKFYVTTVNSDGSLNGAPKEIYTLMAGEDFKMKDGLVQIQRPRSAGGSITVCLTPEGIFSEAGRRDRLLPLRDNDYSALKFLADDMKLKSQMGAFNNIVDRPTYYSQMARILKGKENTWVNLVGPFGAGATSVVQGFVRSIQRQTLAEKEMNAFDVYNVSMGKLMKQASVDTANKAQGVNEVEKFIQASAKKKVILVMDSFLDDPSLGATNIKSSLESFLRIYREHILRGEILMITTANNDQWNELTTGFPQIKELSTVIEVSEPSQDILMQILNNKRSELQEQYNVQFDKDVAAEAQKFSAKIYPSEKEPRRSVNLMMDLAKAYGSTGPKNSTVAVSAATAHQFFLNKILNLSDLKIDMKKLKERLDYYLVGQDDAKEIMLSRMQSLASGAFNIDGGPLATMLFIGPTGVGKTYSAQILAESLGLPFIRVPMQYFKGFGKEMNYTKDILRNAGRPFVLLLDEMDKKSEGGPTPSDRFQRLRSVLETGIWGQGTEEELNLKTSILILTGNHADQLILKAGDISHNDLLGQVQSFVTETDKTKTPENQQIAPNVWSYLVNSTAIYRPLNKNQLAQVAGKFAAELGSKIEKQKNVKVVVNPRVLQNTVENSYRDSLGVVPVRQGVFENIGNKIQMHLAENTDKSFKEIFVTLSADGGLLIINDSQAKYNEYKTKALAAAAKTGVEK